MKQQCPMVFIYLFWALVIGAPVVFALNGEYVLAVAWVVVLPVAQWAYVRTFSHTSRFLGYGRVDDRPADQVSSSPVTVTMYTALSCPFCPIVKSRLQALQERMGFELREVDVTLRPDLLKGKGIRAVPVVEVEGRTLAGHATTQELAALIQGSWRTPATRA